MPITKDQIEEWLRRNDTDSEDGSIPEEVEGVDWALTVEYPDTERPVNVFSRNGGNLLQLQRGIELSDEHHDALLKISAERFEEFRFGLVQALLIQPVQYRLVMMEEEQDFRAFGLLYTIWEDDISQNSFMNGLQAVHDATIVMISRIEYTTRNVRG